MDLTTRIFGKISIDEDQVLIFRQGLPGFEALRRFALVDLEQTRPFIWLQSLERDVALPLISPFAICADYAPEIDDSVIADLDIRREEDLLVYAVVVIPPDVRQMTANLAAPILINMASNQGRQAIVEDDRYPIRQPVFAAVCAGQQEDPDHACGDSKNQRSLSSRR
jgi:flagellar assembly factor FliW